MVARRGRTTIFGTMLLPCPKCENLNKLLGSCDMVTGWDCTGQTSAQGTQMTMWQWELSKRPARERPVSFLKVGVTTRIKERWSSFLAHVIFRTLICMHYCLISIRLISIVLLHLSPVVYFFFTFPGCWWLGDPFERPWHHALKAHEDSREVPQPPWEEISNHGIPTFRVLGETRLKAACCLPRDFV